MFTHLDRDEWARVVSHTRSHLGGVLKVRRLEKGIQRFIVHEHRPRIEDYDAREGHELLDPRDDAFTLCPFYTFDPSAALFGCNIHGIKSRTCKAFMCEGSERFGQEIELCDPCWINDLPTRHHDADAQKRIPPCELAVGCPDLEYRVQFFIAYARNHRDDPRIPSKKQFLLSILARNIVRFTEELLAIGFDAARARESVSYLDALIVPLNSV